MSTHIGFLKNFKNSTALMRTSQAGILYLNHSIFIVHIYKTDKTRLELVVREMSNCSHGHQSEALTVQIAASCFHITFYQFCECCFKRLLGCLLLVKVETASLQSKKKNEQRIIAPSHMLSYPILSLKNLRDQTRAQKK